MITNQFYQKGYLFYCLMLAVSYLVPSLLISQPAIRQEPESYFSTANRKVIPSVVKIDISGSVPTIRNREMAPSNQEEDNRTLNRDGENNPDEENSLDIQRGTRARPVPPMFNQIQSGTGIIISPDGYILSTYHLVRGRRMATVTLSNGRQYQAQFVNGDAALDIALLKVSATRLPAVDFAENPALRIRQRVALLGYPSDSETRSSRPIVVLGTVRDSETSVPQLSRAPLLLLDAPVSLGYGGGPVINSRGEVVGIVIAYKSDDELNQDTYAIPIDRVKRVIDDLMGVQSNERQPWMGVNIRDLTSTDARQLRLPGTRGALVTQVVPNGPADKGGLLVNDVVLEYNHQQVSNTEQLKGLVADSEIGSRALLLVMRRGNGINLTLRIESQDNTIRVAPKVSRDSNQIVIQMDRNGMTINGQPVRLRDLLENISSRIQGLIESKIYVIINTSEEVDSTDIDKIVEVCQRLGITKITIKTIK